MNLKCTIKFLALVFMLLIALSGDLCSQNTQENSGEEKITAPAIDGRINDSQWAGAKIISDFYMMIPKSDSKDYDSTIAYIKETNDAIYIAIKYWPRGKIIKQSLTMDRSTDEENESFILLDPENKNLFFP